MKRENGGSVAWKGVLKKEEASSYFHADPNRNELREEVRSVRQAI